MQGRDKKPLTSATLLKALSVLPDLHLFLLVWWLSKQKVSCHVVKQRYVDAMHRYPFRKATQSKGLGKAAAKG